MTHKQQTLDSYHHVGLLKGDQLGRVVEAGKIWKPEGIRLEGDRICWNAMPKPFEEPLREVGEHVESTPSMLADFWGLAFDGSPAKVLRFAKKWGVLALSRYEGERQLRDSIYVDGAWHAVGVAHFSGEVSEPIHTYANIARHFRAWLDTLRNCVNLDPKQPATVIARENAFAFTDPLLANRRFAWNPEAPDKWEKGVTRWGPFTGWLIRQIFRQADGLLSVSGVRVGLTVRDRKPKATVAFADQHELLGALALQLVPLLTGHRAMYVCSICAEPILSSKRILAENEGRYCSVHRNSAERAAMRKRKQRERERDAKA